MPETQPSQSASGTDPRAGDRLSNEELAAWAIRGAGWWGGEDEAPERLLLRMSALSAERAEIVPLRHPRLLHPTTLDALAGKSPAEARGALHRLRELSAYAYAGTLVWPFGVGPVEALARQVHARLMSLDQALQLAPAIGQRGDIIAPYARAVAVAAVQQGREGQSGASVQLAAVLLSAARAVAPSSDRVDGWSAWRWACYAYVEVAKVRLSAMPDDRLYWSARKVTDEVLAWAHDAGPDELASAWSLQGRFLLDVYSGDKQLSQPELAYDAWRERRSASLLSPDDADEGDMPDPAVALRGAVHALRRAVELSPSRKGTDWKALVQAQRDLALVDPDAHEHGASADQRLATARSALTRLDPVGDAHVLPFVDSMVRALERQAGVAGGALTDTGEQPTLQHIAQTSGVRQAVQVGLWRLTRELEGAGKDAEGLLADLDRLAKGHSDEDLREHVLDAHLHVLRRALPDDVTSSGGSIRKRLRRLERLHATASPSTHADALLALAATSGRTDDERLGLELVESALRLDWTLQDRRRTALGWLSAKLHYGEACRLGARGKTPEAIAEYALAAVGFTRCGQPTKVRHCVERIARDAADNTQSGTATVLAFARHGLELERSVSADTNGAIAEALRRASSQLQRRVAPDLPLLRDQVAKGLRFAAAVASPSPLTLDERARRLLHQAAALERQVAEGDSAGAAEAGLDDEDMLASFVAPSEATPGRTPAEILLNTQRAFDEHLATVRYGSGSPSPGEFLSVHDLQALLGPRTVLVSTYLSTGPDGELCVQVQALTHREHRVAVVPQRTRSGTLVLEASGLQLTQQPVAPIVSDLRRRIVEDPLFGDVDEQAHAVLRSQLPRWFGPFAEALADWRQAGLDHLVVWPHGPLHYLPWHLFAAAPGGGPLGDDWTVTVLPTAGVLHRTPIRTGEGMVAVASAEGGRPFGLRRATTMPAQAATVAACFGTDPLPLATPARLRAALPGARYVHVAAHGSHVEEAPAFQCLYLDAEPGADGRLFAHEVAQLNLSGVELVTLSACESLLGRFDVGDNLRGLPAALLSAGASAVVGALWPVAPDAATTFFTRLYSLLAHGSDRLSAFRGAQLATRRSHPEYRDWGALTYVGDWR